VFDSLKLVRTNSLPLPVNVGEDCPVFEGLFEFCSISAGGSIGKRCEKYLVLKLYDFLRPIQVLQTNCLTVKLILLSIGRVVSITQRKARLLDSAMLMILSWAYLNF
jgi:hypothetical protein